MLVQVAGHILEIEEMAQTDATRKRMKHLAHLPLSGETVRLLDITTLPCNSTLSFSADQYPTHPMTQSFTGVFEPDCHLSLSGEAVAPISCSLCPITAFCPSVPLNSAVQHMTQHMTQSLGEASCLIAHLPMSSGVVTPVSSFAW